MICVKVVIFLFGNSFILIGRDLEDYILKKDDSGIAQTRIHMKTNSNDIY